MTENTEPDPVDLATALTKMKDDGHPPTGFHMMFFSPEFENSEDCPTLQLFKMLGEEYDFIDTIKRQVFQMPKDQVIISYEFAWLGGFEAIESTLNSLDEIIATQLGRMVEQGILQNKPQARISFLAEMPETGEEE
jgi:hypothetical protein